VTPSGIAISGQVGEGNFEFPSVNEVAATDAARRARERVELVNLLSLLAGATPNLCCNDLNVEAGCCQSGSCDCDGPGAEECVGDCSGQCANAQPDGLDASAVVISDGLLDGNDDRVEQTEFMHPPMMAEPTSIEPAQLAGPAQLAEPAPQLAEPAPQLAELVEAPAGERP
jgi:hypothetical protein